MQEVLAPGTKRKSAVKPPTGTRLSSVLRERKQTEVRSHLERFMKYADTHEEYGFLLCVLQAWQMTRFPMGMPNTAGLFVIPRPSSNHSEVSGVTPSEIRQ